MLKKIGTIIIIHCQTKKEPYAWFSSSAMFEVWAKYLGESDSEIPRILQNLQHYPLSILN